MPGEEDPLIMDSGPEPSAAAAEGIGDPGDRQILKAPKARDEPVKAALESLLREQVISQIGADHWLGMDRDRYEELVRSNEDFFQKKPFFRRYRQWIRASAGVRAGLLWRPWQTLGNLWFALSRIPHWGKYPGHREFFWSNVFNMVFVCAALGALILSGANAWLNEQRKQADGAKTSAEESKLKANAQLASIRDKKAVTDAELQCLTFEREIGLDMLAGLRGQLGEKTSELYGSKVKLEAVSTEKDKLGGDRKALLDSTIDWLQEDLTMALRPDAPPERAHNVFQRFSAFNKGPVKPEGDELGFLFTDGEWSLRAKVSNQPYHWIGTEDGLGGPFAMSDDREWMAAYADAQRLVVLLRHGSDGGWTKVADASLESASGGRPLGIVILTPGKASNQTGPPMSLHCVSGNQVLSWRWVPVDASGEGKLEPHGKPSLLKMAVGSIGDPAKVFVSALSFGDDGIIVAYANNLFILQVQEAGLTERAKAWTHSGGGEGGFLRKRVSFSGLGKDDTVELIDNMESRIPGTNVMAEGISGVAYQGYDPLRKVHLFCLGRYIGLENFPVKWKEIEEKKSGRYDDVSGMMISDDEWKKGSKTLNVDCAPPLLFYSLVHEPDSGKEGQLRNSLFPVNDQNAPIQAMEPVRDANGDYLGQTLVFTVGSGKARVSSRVSCVRWADHDETDDGWAPAKQYRDRQALLWTMDLEDLKSVKLFDPRPEARAPMKFVEGRSVADAGESITIRKEESRFFVKVPGKNEKEVSRKTPAEEFLLGEMTRLLGAPNSWSESVGGRLGLVREQMFYEALTKAFQLKAPGIEFGFSSREDDRFGLVRGPRESTKEPVQREDVIHIDDVIGRDQQRWLGVSGGSLVRVKADYLEPPAKGSAGRTRPLVSQSLPTATQGGLEDERVAQDWLHQRAWFAYPVSDSSKTLGVVRAGEGGVQHSVHQLEIGGRKLKGAEVLALTAMPPKQGDTERKTFRILGCISETSAVAFVAEAEWDEEAQKIKLGSVTDLTFADGDRPSNVKVVRAVSRNGESDGWTLVTASGDGSIAWFAVDESFHGTKAGTWNDWGRSKDGKTPYAEDLDVVPLLKGGMRIAAVTAHLPESGSELVILDVDRDSNVTEKWVSPPSSGQKVEVALSATGKYAASGSQYTGGHGRVEIWKVVEGERPELRKLGDFEHVGGIGIREIRFFGDDAVPRLVSGGDGGEHRVFLGGLTKNKPYPTLELFSRVDYVLKYHDTPTPPNYPMVRGVSVEEDSSANRRFAFLTVGKNSEVRCQFQQVMAKVTGSNSEYQPGGR